MGKQNRQRRAAKQRQRQRGSSPPAPGRVSPARSGPPPGAGRFGDGQFGEARSAPPPGDGLFGEARRPSPPRLTVADATTLIQVAAQARSVRERADRVAVLEVLAVYASEPSGCRVVDTALARAAGLLLAGLWEDGWQPADLARIVGHRASPTHRSSLVDAVARQGVDLPLADAPAAWRSQLEEIGARVWWDERRPYLVQWSERAGLGVRRLLEVAVEVLATLLTLPAQPRLCPPPSAWSSATAGEPRLGGLDPKVLAKVRGLLAKAESTEFPEEAEALSAKAQELITRHAIDQALLASSEAQSAPPGARRVPVEDPYAAGKAHLLHAIASANRCRTVWSKRYGFCTAFGYPSDLDAVELLHASLLVQATSAMAAAGPQVDARGVTRTRSFRSSFLTAFADRIGERLRQTTESSVSTADDALGDGRLLPVLAAREEAVEEALAEAFPDLVSHRVQIGNHAGWAAGRLAADRAELAVGPRVDGQRRLSA
ncbi:MAG: DUF2786 domain-containing protein [Acidimicrobiales bacterium]